MQDPIVRQSVSDNSLVQQNSAEAQNDPQATQVSHPDNPTEPHGTAAPAAQQNERWAKIPQALRELPQWCVAGSDKAPRIAKDGLSRASSTDRSTWRDFKTACAVAAREGLHIGYMLSQNDPFTCIDIDVKNVSNESNPDKWTTQEQMSRFEKIVGAFDSYTERSKSGVGVHVWVMGNTGIGCKRDGVEIYSQERFIICTGDVVRALPVRENQHLLEVLKKEIGRGTKEQALELVELDPVEEDIVILDRALDASNCDKFNALCNLTSDTYQSMGYPSQSEADIALMSMFAFYSKSNEQCRRLFRMTGLGKREKATKDNRYLNATLKKAREFAAADAAEEATALADGKQMVDGILKTIKQNSEVPTASVLVNEDDWIVSISDVLSNPSPAPEFLTEQLMPAGEVTLFAAHGGTGKSLLMLMWAVHASLGRPFLGKRVTQAPAIFYSAEDQGDVVRYRLGKICHSLGFNPNEVARFLTIVDATNTPVLFEERSNGKFGRSTATTDAYERLKRLGDKLAARYIFIDNASYTYAADEIKRAQVQAFLRALRALGIDRKAGVMLASHVDKQSAKGNGGGQDFSGSTQWHNSVRSRLFMAAAEDGSGLVLTQGKSNHGKKSEEIRLEWTDDGLLEMVTAAEIAATRSVEERSDTDQLLKIYW
ncbi:MAG: hypothetical protein EOO38_08960 [Cytophagaceae bacterium]|nr:MAG: hypothetical protein EOO38_08960 [Cytophagaceae bacterium]